MVCNIAVFKVASTNTRNPILYVCEYSTAAFVHTGIFYCISLISVINGERFKANVASRYASELYTKD